MNRCFHSEMAECLGGPVAQSLHQGYWFDDGAIYQAFECIDHEDDWLMWIALSDDGVLNDLDKVAVHLWCLGELRGLAWDPLWRRYTGIRHRVMSLLKKQEDAVHALAQALIEQGQLEADEIEQMALGLWVGERPSGCRIWNYAWRTPAQDLEAENVADVTPEILVADLEQIAMEVPRCQS